jgi:hydroxypyruvate isomerase
MARLAANLTMLFNEVPFMDRFEQAAQHGFKGVEFLFPYDFEPADIAAKLEQHDLKLVLHNLPAGDWAAGERGIACHPDRVEEFRSGVDKAIRYAKALKVPQVNCLAGIVPKGVSREEALSTMADNVRFAAGKLKAEGIRLLVEPVNTYDIPGFALATSADGLGLIEKSGSDNVFLQYDIYHMQRMEGELAATIKKHFGKIKHIQLADNPGRFEPGTGEINYGYLFRMLDEIGYDGWIGCEYKPKAGTVEGLGWRGAHRL